MNEGIRMQLSAFVDGELPANEAELLMRRMGQDAELRKEVAEYLAIGRLIRAEAGLAGADRLYERVAAEIGQRQDDPSAVLADAEVISTGSRSIRPLAGFAIAASVALVAIFALQQTAEDPMPAQMPVPVANSEPTSGVPSMDAQLEKQRVLFRKHAETSSQYGTTGLISQVVTLNFSEDLVDDPELEADDAEQTPRVEPQQPEPVTQP